MSLPFSMVESLFQSCRVLFFSLIEVFVFQSVCWSGKRGEGDSVFLFQLIDRDCSFSALWYMRGDLH